MLAGRRALVTGASAGIGAATVRQLVGSGAAVHAVARRADRLAALSDEVGCSAHVSDLTDPQDRARLAAIEPDILVNNAGLGAGITGLEGASLAEIEQTIGTNVTAVLDLVRLCLPGLRARSGHVVLLGSVAGLYPGPSAIYGASKGAIRQIGWNLRRELRGTGVRVTEILPGRVRTEFYDAAVPDESERARLKETGIRELQPEDIAAAILYAVSVPRYVNVSAIELQPLEQTFGGISFDRVTP
ncbi:MAG: SDR family oxidoreductase [Pseudomonadota bacterium]